MLPAKCESRPFRTTPDAVRKRTNESAESIVFIISLLCVQKAGKRPAQWPFVVVWSSRKADVSGQMCPLANSERPAVNPQNPSLSEAWAHKQAARGKSPLAIGHGRHGPREKRGASFADSRPDCSPSNSRVRLRKQACGKRFDGPEVAADPSRQAGICEFIASPEWPLRPPAPPARDALCRPGCR